MTQDASAAEPALSSRAIWALIFGALRIGNHEFPWSMETTAERQAADRLHFST